MTKYFIIPLAHSIVEKLKSWLLHEILHRGLKLTGSSDQDNQPKPASSAFVHRDVLSGYKLVH